MTSRGAASNRHGAEADDVAAQAGNQSHLRSLRAALQWSIENEDAESAMRLAVDLALFWDVRWETQEGKLWMDRVLALPGADTSVRVEALLSAAEFALWGGDMEAASAHVRQARAMGERLGDNSLVADALHKSGNTLMFRDIREAARLYDEVAKITRQDGRSGFVPQLGAAQVLLGETVEAESMVERLYALDPAHRHPRAEYVRGLASLYRGDLDDAVADLASAVESLGAGGDSWEQLAKLSLARALFNSGDLDAAEEIAARLSQTARAAGTHVLLAFGLNQLGRIALRRAEFERARHSFEEALLISAPGLLDMVTADTLRFIGELEAVTENPRKAIQLISAGDQLRQRVGHVWPQTEQKAHQGILDSVTQEIGSAAFATAWDEGAVMTVEEAVADALERNSA